MITKTMWRITGSVWVDTDPELDVIALTVSGRGKEFAVTCAGPKGMEADEFITAIRAAAAGMLLAVGGDMSQVGAESVEESAFDTGDQRPS